MEQYETEPVKLRDLKPGVRVPQEPKRLVSTYWTEEGVTLRFSDGSEHQGSYDDALYVLREA